MIVLIMSSISILMKLIYIAYYPVVALGEMESEPGALSAQCPSDEKPGVLDAADECEHARERATPNLRQERELWCNELHLGRLHRGWDGCCRLRRNRPPPPPMPPELCCARFGRRRNLTPWSLWRVRCPGTAFLRRDRSTALTMLTA